MNICFYTAFEISPIQGGTERITYTIAKNLKDIYGWKCYSVFSAKSRTGKVSDIFDGSVLIANPSRDKNQLKSILLQWEINVFINQGAFYLSKMLAEILQSVGSKYVFCHHFEPGWEVNFLSFLSSITKWRENKSLNNFVKIWLYPYYKFRNRRILPKQYEQTYQVADKVVLLSRRFIPQFVKYGSIKDNQNFIVIHNSLSFESFYNVTKLNEKEKMVLIVSRMDETQKRISYALKIWREVEKSGDFPDWSLHIVGTGNDLDKYIHYVNYKHLKHVFFEGSHPSESFYKRASLFMMTSQSEGWGLTLTEAQQNGCVPLAFDTYASLHEIITDGYNGYIITKDDLKGYVERLKEIMRDDSLRKQLALTAINSSHRFEQNRIIKQWYNLLQNVFDKR